MVRERPMLAHGLRSVREQEPCGVTKAGPLAIDFIEAITGGKKRVESIPAAWVNTIRPRVEAGRHFKETGAELLRINAELLVLARNQRRTRRHPTPSPP